MSGLVCLFIVVAEDPRGTIHPTIAAAVMTAPTHGVTALVRAWHERVESTSIRVRVVRVGRGARAVVMHGCAVHSSQGHELLPGCECAAGERSLPRCVCTHLLQVILRILGTAVGATLGYVALLVTGSPPLLLLIMGVVAVGFAPLASASFHLRLATALTLISMTVVVLCQFDPGAGESRATTTFYGTRILEVRVGPSERAAGQWRAQTFAAAAAACVEQCWVAPRQH